VVSGGLATSPSPISSKFIISFDGFNAAAASSFFFLFSSFFFYFFFFFSSSLSESSESLLFFATPANKELIASCFFLSPTSF
jgi:hypothetical protein